MELTRENRSTERKTCPSAILPITNSTWTSQGSNPGLRCERSVTNHLSHSVTTFPISFQSSFMWFLYSPPPTISAGPVFYPLLLQLCIIRCKSKWFYSR